MFPLDDRFAEEGGAPVPPSKSPPPPPLAGGARKHPRPPPPALSAAEKLMARREALALLMRADEAFRRCDPRYLEAVDNYAYLCLGESRRMSGSGTPCDVERDRRGSVRFFFFACWGERGERRRAAAVGSVPSLPPAWFR